MPLASLLAAPLAGWSEAFPACFSTAAFSFALAMVLGARIGVRRISAGRRNKAIFVLADQGQTDVGKCPITFLTRLSMQMRFAEEKMALDSPVRLRLLSQGCLALDTPTSFGYGTFRNIKGAWLAAQPLLKE